MPTFEYQGVSQDGEAVRGQLFGASLDAAMAQLRQQGMEITQIGVAKALGDPLQGVAVAPLRREEAPAATAPIEAGPWTDHGGITGSAVEAPEADRRPWVARELLGPIFGKVPLVQLQFFFRQLATMLHAGVPFVQSLDTLSGQTTSRKLKGIILEMRDNVSAGRPISVAMQRYPEVFSSVMVSLTRAGEEGGVLENTLRTLADYIEREVELRNLYRRVLFYPKLVLFFSIIIVLGTNAIIGAVAPGGRGLNSPLTTLTTWYILGPLIIATFLFLRVGLANPRVRYVWDMALLMVPYLGKTLQQLSMAKFGRAFGALYKGGVPLPKAVVLAADACGNEYLRSKIHPSVGRLEEGEGVEATFRQSGAFSPIVLDMVSTGERTGNLDDMLNKVADYYEDESDVRAKALGHVTGVVVYLMVAIYVGYMVVSFYGGYFGGIMKESQ